jgi:hypothetical protein
MEERISILRQDLVETVKFVDELVVSLDRIGSSTAELTAIERAKVADRYLDEWNVFRRASAVRRALAEYFDRELGSEDMDELERELGGTVYWSPQGPRPAFDPDQSWWRAWRVE